MKPTRTARRREIKQNQLIDAERRSAAKQNDALNAFHDKYIKCTDQLLKEITASENVSPLTSKTLLNAAVGIAQKLIRDSGIIANKMGNNQIQPEDVNFASMNLYKSKYEQFNEIQKVVNNQAMPKIGRTAMHFPPVQKLLVSNDLVDQPLRKKSKEASNTASNGTPMKTN